MQLPKIPLRLTLLIFIIAAGYSVEALTCYVCSSDKLASCATLQNERKDLPSVLCPIDTEYCFTKIENDVTIRGCSPIEQPIAERIDEDHHETCDTNKCNNDIFPEDRLFCLHCAGSSCVNQPSTIDVNYPCVNYAVDDKCYSIFSPDGKFAYRGCKSEPQKSFGKTYCNQHVQQCVECSDNGCNDKPLEWSKEQISCIKCKSANGEKCDEIDENVEAEECAPVVEGYQNECYTFIGKDGVERGCLYEATAVVQKKCIDKESCDLCKDSGCNRVKAVNTMPEKSENVNNQLNSNFRWNWNPLELEQCIACDSKTHGDDCRNKPEKFKGHNCKGPKQEGCFVSIVGDHYERGCISELSQNKKDKCLEQSTTCKSFHGSNSNDVTSFQKCYKCNSHDDPNCSNKVPPHTDTEVCELTTSTCTTGVDKYGITHRRCSKDKSVEEKFFKYHETCEGAKCNSKIFPQLRQQCYQCNGDSDCDLSDEKHKTENAPCNVYSELDKCYTYQDKDNKIYRGCLSDSTNSRMLCESNPSKCIKCSDLGCNKQPKKDIEFYPKDRLQCYRCSGDSDCDFTDGKIKKEKVPCEISSKFDQCFSYMDSDKKMHRGCLSDASDSKLFCVSDPLKCAKCKVSGCNNQSKFRKVAFSCIHCDDDKDCGYEQEKTKSKACPAEILPYYMKDACFARTFTNIKSDKKTFKRGCITFNEATEVSIPDGMCFESNCNKNKIKAEQCQKCSSKIGGDCSVVKGKNISAKCESDYPYGKRGCFTLVKDDKVERGCVKDLKDRHDECLKNPGACAICETDDCNNEDRNKIERNFGHRVTSTILLNIFAVFVLFLYY